MDARLNYRRLGVGWAKRDKRNALRGVLPPCGITIDVVHSGQSHGRFPGHPAEYPYQVLADRLGVRFRVHGPPGIMEVTPRLGLIAH